MIVRPAFPGLQETTSPICPTINGLFVMSILGNCSASLFIICGSTNTFRVSLVITGCLIGHNLEKLVQGSLPFAATVHTSNSAIVTTPQQYARNFPNPDFDPRSGQNNMTDKAIENSPQGKSANAYSLTSTHIMPAKNKAAIPPRFTHKTEK